MTTTDSKPGTDTVPGRVIDLDAARAGRAEAAGEPVTLRMRGQDFTLPVEMPVDFALYAKEGELRKAISALLGDGSDEFFALRPSLGDFEALAREASTVYGVGEGKSSASASS